MRKCNSNLRDEWGTGRDVRKSLSLVNRRASIMYLDRRGRSRFVAADPNHRDFSFLIKRGI